MIPLFPDRSRPLLFAHRGCSSLAPENTFPAFQKAKEVNAPGIELDVHVCASGELVVAHDDTFTRTAGDPRAIQDLTFKEIRTLEAGSFFDPPVAGAYPPLLEEVLDAFCPDMYVDIELKTRKIAQDPLPALVAEKLKSLGNRISQSVSISSFNPFSLRAFKRVCPGIPIALIWSAHREVPLGLRHGFGRFIAPCDYLKPVYQQVHRLSPRNLPRIPWTIDDPALGARLLDLGCEGIITNRPQDFPYTIPATSAAVGSVKGLP